MHILALDSKIEGNQSLLFSSSGTDGNPSSFTDTNVIVAKRFPDAVSDGRLLNNGALTDVVGHLDVSKTEKTFGFKPKSYEDTIVSVVGHYLELLEKESKEPTTSGH